MISIFSLSYSRSRDICVAEVSKISVFLLMFVPAALRYDVGTDYFAYVLNFEKISRGINVRLESGFVAINQVSSFLNLGAQGVFAIVAFLTFFFLFLAVPKKSFHIIIPIFFCMYYARSFNMIRNMLAITIVYYAYQKLNKNVLFSFILVYIASLFHISSFLFYPVFLIMLISKLYKTQTVYFFLLTFSVYILGEGIIGFIINTFVPGTPYAYYIGTMKFDKSETSFMFSAVHFFVFITVLYFLPDNKTKASSDIFVFFLVSNFVYVLGSLSGIFGRLDRVFSIMWFPLLQYIDNNNFRFRKLLLLFIFLWSFFSFVVAVGFLESSDVIPYRTIFS